MVDELGTWQSLLSSSSRSGRASAQSEGFTKWLKNLNLRCDTIELLEESICKIFSDKLLLFSCSVLSDSATPWIPACQASLSFTISQSLLKLMSIESVMPSNHLILCHPLLILPSIFTSIRVFSNESALHIRSPKYLLSNEYSGSISFRVDWFDLLAVQGTLKSLL